MKRQEIIYSLDISGADAEFEFTIYEDGSANVFVSGLEGQYFSTLTLSLRNSDKAIIHSQVFNYDRDAFVFEGDIDGFTFEANKIYYFDIIIIGISGSEFRFPDYGTYFEISTFGDTPIVFEWEIPKESEERLRVSASEWNAFLDKINEVREYQGMPTINFKRVVSCPIEGRNVVTKSEANSLNSRCIISYAIIREAVDAILGSEEYMGIPIENKYSELIDVEQGDRISAEFFNNLRDAINSSIE